MNLSGTLGAWFKRALFENFGLKVVAILCSLGFFVFIHGAERAQRVFTVPVVEIRPPEERNRLLLKAPPSEVAITLAGPRNQIDQLTALDLGSVQLDLATGTEALITITQAMFHVPPGVTVEQIFPSRIDLKWDDRVTKRLPIQVARAGTPEAGYAIHGQIFSKPDAVVARGPRSTLELMQVVATTSFDITNFTEGRHERILPLPPPPDFVTFDQNSVVASVEVIREEQTASFAAMKVEVVGSARAKCKPATVTVEVRGTPEAVAALQARKGETIVPRVEFPKDTDLNTPSSMMLDVIVEAVGVTSRAEPPRVLVKW